MTDYDKLFAQLPPAQRRRQAIQNARKVRADAIMAAVSRVENSQDPQAAWAEEATAISELSPGRQPAAVANPWAGHGQVEEPIRPARQLPEPRCASTRAQAGIPAPVVPATLKDAGGGLYSIDESNPAAPKATELVEPKGNYSLYTDANGKTWKVDGRTGDMTPAEANVVAKVGGAGGRRRQFAVRSTRRNRPYHELAVHPGDQARRAGLRFAAASLEPSQ